MFIQGGAVRLASASLKQLSSDTLLVGKVARNQFAWRIELRVQADIAATNYTRILHFGNRKKSTNMKSFFIPFQKRDKKNGLCTRCRAFCFETNGTIGSRIRGPAAQ